MLLIIQTPRGFNRLTHFSFFAQFGMDHWRVAVLGDGGVGKTALSVQVGKTELSVRDLPDPVLQLT